MHMHAEDIIPTVTTSNIHIGWCLLKALTVYCLRSYEMLNVLLIVWINKSAGLCGILNLPQLRDGFPYWLAIVIPLKEGVPLPLQSKVSTPPPHLRWRFHSLQISLNGWLPPRPLHSDGQSLLQPPCRVQAVDTHQHLAESHRQTQCVAFHPAPHPALLSLPLFSAVLKTCLPTSLIQKPAWSLQIHCERELQKGIRDRGSGNCKCRQCVHHDEWSPAVTPSIDLVTLTWRVLYLQWAGSWSSTCRTDSRLWVQVTWRQ